MARYSEELAELQGVYHATLAGLTDDALADLREALSRREVSFVGSGGTFPVAELAASLHQRYTGRLARATTPLRFIETSRFAREATVVLFSARARHPDTGLAAAHARAYGHCVVLITQRDRNKLTGELRHNSVAVLTLPHLDQVDGFLATTSVLAMATTIAAAYAPETLNDRLLKLTRPWRGCVSGCWSCTAKQGAPPRTTLRWLSGSSVSPTSSWPIFATWRMDATSDCNAGWTRPP